MAEHPEEGQVFKGDSKGPLVLVLEDDAAAAGPMVAYLGKEGYDVRIVPRPEDVLGAAQERRPVALVVDERLREREGWARLDDALAQPPLPEIPLIQAAFRPESGAPADEPLTQPLSKPIREEDLQAAMRRLQEHLGRAPSKVLVVDDEEDVRATVTRYLSRAGFAVETAHNGLDALCRAFAFHPDLILMDLRMPGMDGFELLDRLRVYPNTMHVAVFVLTGSELTEEERARLRPKVHAIFRKGGVAFEKLLWHLRWAEKLNHPATPADLGPAGATPAQVSRAARWYNKT